MHKNLIYRKQCFSELNEVAEPALSIGCRELPIIRDFYMYIDIKSVSFSLKNVLRLLSLFLIFQIYVKNKKKWGKKAIIFLTNLLSVSPYAFTFKRNFCEKPWLTKTTLHHACTSYVYREAVLWEVLISTKYYFLLVEKIIFCKHRFVQIDSF